MPIRTLPKNFPPLHESDYHARKIARVQLARKLAQAQNFLWASMFRVYGGCAYEGHGYSLTNGATDPAATETAPDGTTSTKLVAAFACPPNWSASQRLKITGRVSKTNHTLTATGKVIASVWTIDGQYSGRYAAFNMSSDRNGAADFTLTLEVPREATHEIRIHLGASLGVTEMGAADSFELQCVSARYEIASAAEMWGDAPAATWQPIAHPFVANNPPLAAALLRTIVRNTTHLYAYRSPEICHSWLKPANVNTASYAEVGRYAVYVPPRVTQLDGKLGVHSTHAVAGNDVRVLVDGVVVFTSATTAAGYSEIDITPFAVTPGAERVITVQARSTAAGGSTGVTVEGVWIWENDVTLSLPTGTTDPANYVPVDEATIESDDEIAEATWLRIVQNDTWLARQRLRWLVGDWRHRTYKRVAVDGTSSYAAGWDYTRGDSSSAWYPNHRKNITINGNTTWMDATGSTTPDDREGYGYFPNGVDGNNIGFSLDTWPISQEQYQHGRRVGRFRIENHVPGYPINSVTNARVRWYARGRRLAPWHLKEFGAGYYGPLLEDASCRGRAYFEQLLAGVSGMKLPISAANDLVSAWYGPTTGLASQVAAAVTIHGRCPSNGQTGNSLEGALFEVELQATLLLDAPLTQADLNAL